MSPLPAPPHASPWLRASAWVFDTSLALLPGSALAAIVTLPARLRLMEAVPTSLDHTQAVLDYLTHLAGVLLTQGVLCVLFTALIYGIGSTLAEGGFHQATWGKRLVGLRVENEDGQDLTWKQAALRFASGAASWGSLNVGHAMGGFRPDRRMLHDLLSRTVVVAETATHRTRGIAVCWATWALISLGLSAAVPVDPVLTQLLERTMASLAVGM